MDIYERFAPQYAELGLVSIPVDREKHPRVKGWEKLGVESYRKLLIAHADANIALLDGTRGGLTRIDNFVAYVESCRLDLDGAAEGTQVQR